jgi:hypothetical protein
MATRVPATVGTPNLHDQLERIRALAGAIEQRIGDLIYHLDGGTLQASVPAPRLVSGPPAGALALPVPAPVPKPTRRRRWTDPMFARMAAPGVSSLEIRPLDRRHHLVSINRAAAVRMPIGQAAFLQTLAEATTGSNPAAQSGDEFVPWKDKIAVALDCGYPVHTIDVRLGRLRERLWEDFKVSPLLVESRDRQVRFRLSARRAQGAQGARGVEGAQGARVPDGDSDHHT